LTRIDLHRPHETLLHRDWGAILAAPPEEREFNTIAGWLGLDPYEVEDDTAARLERAWASVPSSLRADLFQAVTANDLVAASEWVRTGLREIERSAVQDGRWVDVRKRLQRMPTSVLPWEQGYELATHVRRELGLADVVPLHLEDVLQTNLQMVDAVNPPARSLEGIVALNRASSVCCYTWRKRQDSRRFLAARATMTLLFGQSPDEPNLLSPAPTSNQQRSRAFAAELLAPARLLAARLREDVVDGEQLEDLASEFGVATEVIRRQIQNHRLARLLSQ
jgi:hypothetical protein